jgi:hypothetical protein
MIDGGFHFRSSPDGLERHCRLRPDHALDRAPPLGGLRTGAAEPRKKAAAAVDAAFSAVVRALAAGEIAPDDAATITGVLEMKRKALETIDIERRLMLLEAQMKEGAA